MRERKTVQLALASIVLLFSFVSALPLPSPTIKRPDEFISIVDPGAAPQTVDPAWCYDNPSAELIFNVYETLLFFDGEHVDAYLPSIATKWTIENITGTVSPEGLSWYYRYTFEIRTGVQFHNNDTLNTTDVVYSFERAMVQDRVGGPVWTLYEPLLDAKAAEDLGDLSNPIGVRKVGHMIDHAVESNATHVWFNLAFPGNYTPFLQILCQTWSSILDKAWVNSYVIGVLGRPDWSGDWMLGGDHIDWINYHDPAISPLDSPTPMMMGSGPFMFETLDYTAKYWSIVRFPGYWRGWPAPFPAKFGTQPAGYVEHAVVTWAYTWPTAGPMFLSGDADFYAVPRVVMAGFLGMNGIRCYYPLPMLAVDGFFFTFNVSLSTEYGEVLPPGTFNPAGYPCDLFSDVHVRRAFAYLFNYTRYIDFHYSGEGTKPATAIIPGLPYYDPTIVGYECNVARAAEEFWLAWGGIGKPGAGIPGLLWKTGFTVPLVHNGNWARRSLMDEINFNALPAFNLLYGTMFNSLEFEVTSWPSFLRDMKRGVMPLFAAGWSGDYPDPNDFACPFYHSQGTLARFQGYNNSAMDALIDMGIKAPDGLVRESIYHNIQLLAVEDCPNVPVIQPLGRHFERDWVVDWYYSQLYCGSLPEGIESTAPMSHGIYFYNLWKWYYVEEALQPTAAQPYSGRLPVDVNYDGKVDMKDIGVASKAFGTKPGPPIHPRWVFRADVDNNRQVDMADIARIARNFGKSSPTWVPFARNPHDLAAIVDVVRSGASVTILNATLGQAANITYIAANLGLNTATSTITLRINGTVSDGSPYGFTIAPATSDVHTMLNWTPAVPTGASDTYEIVADVTAVAEEVNTGNNVAVIFVLVVK